VISLKWRRHEAGRIRSAPRFAEHGDASDREGDAMVEVIGIALFVALVWLLVYGMSATEAKGHRPRQYTLPKETLLFRPGEEEWCDASVASMSSTSRRSGGEL